MFLDSGICELKEADLSPGTIEVARIAVSECGFGKTDMILDAGCGFGKTTSYLEKEMGLNTFSLDISVDNLTKTREKAGITKLICADINNLPLSDSYFQGVFCQCVLSLIEDKKRVLNQIFRLLKNSGKLVLSDIYIKKETEKKSIGIKSCLDGAVTKDTITELINSCGFSIDKIEDKTHLLKQMAGQIIFDYGSLSEYRSAVSGAKIFPDCICENFSNYGYLLIIAGKNE